MLAHRVSWEMHFGAIPHGLLVLHRCDNPPCVRPDHLFLGTIADNSRDMVAKGREARPNARLTVADVQDIRARLARGDVGLAISREYGVENSLISQIRRRKIWRSVA
jgi:hypothetical protein